MATIYDVAKAAGVSPKTVSRVLNSDAPVGRATREAVTTAMDRLGYVPSNAARMMRSNRSGLIGLITGAISASPSQLKPAGLPELFIVQGIQQAIAHTGKTLMIADSGGTRERAPHLIKTFVEHRVEGLIYVAEYHQEVDLPPVKGTPIVLANCFDSKGTPAVLPDDRRGQADLVRRLIGAGHTRIAYLTLREDIVATGLRRAGYTDALAEAGIPHDPSLVEGCEMPEAEEAEAQLLFDAIDRLLRLPNPPTVFCCGNDRMAMRVYGILRSRGLKVPDEISVAGYDNYRMIAETLFPPLTTVELPYMAIGARAVQRLIGLISGEGREDPGSAMVAGPVHWRSSVTELRAKNVSQLKLVREDPS